MKMPTTRIDKVLTARGLSKQVSSPEGTLTILDDVTLAIERGETVAVVGASGAGKSTLLALLAGLDEPSAGQVWLADHELTAMDEDGRAAVRARHVGFVFQSFHLVPSLTAIENVMLPLELAGRRDARAAARRSACDASASRSGSRHYPRQLSGGEQQRVAIARAFVTRPDVLFADEPTGNLDTATGERIVDLLFDLNSVAGTTLVLVTHDRALAARCDADRPSRRRSYRRQRVHERAAARAAQSRARSQVRRACRAAARVARRRGLVDRSAFLHEPHRSRGDAAGGRSAGGGSQARVGTADRSTITTSLRSNAASRRHGCCRCRAWSSSARSLRSSRCARSSAGYPLRGHLKIADAPFGTGRVTDEVPAPGEAWADSRLLARLDAPLGSRVNVGSLNVAITRVLDYRPDQGSGFADLSATLLINLADMDATKLVQPGSRVRYAALYAGTPGQVEAFRQYLETHKQRVERLQTIADASPQIRASSDRAGRFLSLASLVSVLLAAVAVAMAARRYASRHLDRTALHEVHGRLADADPAARRSCSSLRSASSSRSQAPPLGYLAQTGLAWLLRDLLRGELPPPTGDAFWLGLVTAVVVLRRVCAAAVAAAQARAAGTRAAPQSRATAVALQRGLRSRGRRGARAAALAVRDTKLVLYVAAGMAATFVAARRSRLAARARARAVAWRGRHRLALRSRQHRAPRPRQRRADRGVRARVDGAAAARRWCATTCCATGSGACRPTRRITS